MAQSYVLYNGTGASQALTVPFGYLDRDHVSVLVDSVDTPFTWNSDTSIQVTTTVGTANVRVLRTTPKAPLTVFSDGQGLVADDLNVQGLQLQYITEEQEDAYLENELTNLSVDSSKIVDSAVTTTKINNLAVTTAKINDDAVTTAKLAEMAARTVLANDTASTANPTHKSIDDLSVLADNSTTRRDLSARFADALNGLDYGMVGDGSTDDLAAFQAVVNAANSTGKAIVLPPKTYLVSDTVLIKSDVTIFGYGATIKAASTMTKDKIVLLYSDATWQVGIANTKTYGLTVDGNRANRSSGSNAGANFYVSAGARHLFVDCVALNSTQEGFEAAGNTGWVGGLCTMVSFINCRTDNCYRNGLSLTGTDRATLLGGQYNSTTGADPQAGIDIEPNGSTSPNKDFYVAGVSCKGNAKWGLALYNGTWNTGHIVGVNLSGNGICGLINTASTSAVRVQGVTGESNVTSLIATTAVDANANAIDLAETSNRPIQSVAQLSASGGSFSSTSYASSGYSKSITLPKANCTVQGMARFNCLLTESSGTSAEAFIEIRDEAGTAVDTVTLKIQAGGNGANPLVLNVPVMLGWTQSNGSTLTKTYTAWIKVTAGTDSVQINNYSFHLIAIP